MYAKQAEELAPFASSAVVAEPLPVEIAFLEQYGVDRAALVSAAAVARTLGVMADRALLTAGALSAEHFYRLLAEHIGVPFLHDPLPVADSVPIDAVMDAEIIPLAPNAQGVVFAIAPRGATLALLLERYGPHRGGHSARVAVTTPRRMAALVRRRHRSRIVREASHALPDWNPRLSAFTGWSLGQRAFGLLLAAAITAGLITALASTTAAICLALSLIFLAAIGIRLLATALSPVQSRSPERRIPDEDLPVYTVVVPLYREGRMVPGLIQALSRLDYPVARLDIKLVLEAGDRGTLAAVHAERLPDCFEVLLAPAGLPRTKPRALNVALRYAIGGFVVIYDAEDEPEPGQLREAVAAFAAAHPTVGCLQARLAIDNDSDSWLTRLFALEYAALFDVINPGLARLGLPIPLGGTSNHFRIEALRAVYGWDAWNVTEDVDLGIRLARFGVKIAMLASTTFEEAPHTLKGWLGQRTRWQKGWMITLKTHSRNPGRLLAEIGLVNGVATCAMLCGTVATALLWPFFVAAVGIEARFGSLLRPVTLSEKAWSGLSVTLLLGGLASLVWPALRGMRRRLLAGRAVWLLAMPAYMTMQCYASWAALFEMIGRPYAWTKTEHGVAKKRVSRP